jgi:hypothetical protein
VCMRVENCIKTIRQLFRKGSGVLRPYEFCGRFIPDSDSEAQSVLALYIAV